MKLLRSKKFLVIGILQISVSLFSLAVCIWYKSTHNLFVAFLLLVSGFISIINAISPGFLGEKQAESFQDERDVHIASKCILITSRIMFYCVIIAVFIFGLLWYIYENTLFLWVSVSLLSCLLVCAVVYLIANIYYEKRI